MAKEKKEDTVVVAVTEQVEGTPKQTANKVSKAIKDALEGNDHPKAKPKAEHKAPSKAHAKEHKEHKEPAKAQPKAHAKPKAAHHKTETPKVHTASHPHGDEQHAGSIITIMGTAKGNVDITDAMSAITNAAASVYEDIEVVHLPNVDFDLVKRATQNEDDADLLEVLATPEGRVTGALVMHQFKRFADREDAEDNAVQAMIDAMSPTDRKAYEDRQTENTRRIIREAHESSERRRQDALSQAFDVAQKWSTTPDLTPRERVHGAVQEVYNHYGETRGCDSLGRTMEVNPGRDYANRFETHFAEDIKARSIRAAKDLFGNGK